MGSGARSDEPFAYIHILSFRFNGAFVGQIGANARFSLTSDGRFGISVFIQKKTIRSLIYGERKVVFVLLAAVVCL